MRRHHLHAWQVTGEPFYRTIAEETLDHVVREMRLAMGEDLTHIIDGGTVRPIAPMEEGPALPAKL